MCLWTDHVISSRSSRTYLRKDASSGTDLLTRGGGGLVCQILR